MTYGCYNRTAYAPYYLPTGAPDTPAYRIPQRLSGDCQYTHTDLGQADAGCAGCKHRKNIAESLHKR